MAPTLVGKKCELKRGGPLLCVCGVGVGAELSDGSYTFLFAIYLAHKTLQLCDWSESVFGRVARESKVEVVERRLNHTNM